MKTAPCKLTELSVVNKIWSLVRQNSKVLYMQECKYYLGQAKAKWEFIKKR